MRSKLSLIIRWAASLQCIAKTVSPRSLISLCHLAVALGLFCNSFTAQAQQTVATGKTYYTTAPFGYATACSGCHITDAGSGTFPTAAAPSAGHLLASNNPGHISTALAGAMVAYVFSSPPDAFQRAALAMFIGQYKVPVPAPLVININGTATSTGSVDAYPSLPTNGTSGVAKETGGGLTVTSSANSSNSATITASPADGTLPHYTLTYNRTNASFVGTENLSYSVINPSGTGTANLTVNVIGITSGATGTTVPTGASNALYTITTNGSVVANSYAVSGALPTGVNLDISNGVISGTPGSGTAGTYPVTVSVNTSVGIVSKSVTLTVVGITSAATASGDTTNGFSYTIATNGVINGAYGVSGTLPSGVTLNAGVLSGTPAVGSAGTYTPTVSVATSAGTVSKQITITIDGITSSGTASGTQNAAFTTYQIGAQLAPLGGNPYQLTGTLPTGLNFSTASGQITGTPSQNGTFLVTVLETTASGLMQRPLQITIAAVAPVVSGTPALATAPSITTVGQVGTLIAPIQVNATNPSVNGFTYSITSGALPGGLSLHPGSGVISGTPNASGDFDSTITVNNGTTGSLAVRLRVNSTQAPLVNSVATASGTVGTNATVYTITTTGANGPVTGYSLVSGTLPPGLSLDTSTGVVSGTPSASGITTVRLGASNSGGFTGTLDVTITIYPNTVPTISAPVTGSSTILLQGPVSIPVTANNPPFTAFTVSAGSLPSGLTLAVAPDGLSGLISGTATTPTASNVIGITATNAAGTSAPVTFSLAVAGITNGSALALTQNAATNLPFQVSALPSAGAPYAMTGTIPPGLSFNTTTGQLSGTPTTSGNYPVLIQATTGAGAVSSPLAITVTSAGIPVISTTPAYTAAPAITTLGPVGSAIANIQINASNPPINASSFTATGLPPGLSLNAATGVISGTPTTSGDYAVQLGASNTSGAGSYSVILRVNATNGPVINSPATATGTVGTNATVYTITTSGANGPIAGYAIASGTLPAGLTLNASTGAIAGTPTASGISSVVVQATNSGGLSGTQTVTVTIYPNTVPGITAPTAGASLSFGVGAVSIPITATNPPFTAITVTAGTLPAGLAVSLANGGLSGLISGTATTPTANAAISITATNAAGVSAPLTFNLAITAPVPGSCSISTPVNTAGTVDLKTCMFPSLNPTGMRIVTAPGHGTTSVNGTSVTYTPVNNFFGTDSFTAMGLFGSASGAVATVSITVTGRPDPTKDAAVAALTANQVQTAIRFTQAQVSNFGRHMEGLRRPGGGLGMRRNLGGLTPEGVQVLNAPPGNTSSAWVEPAPAAGNGTFGVAALANAANANYSNAAPSSFNAASAGAAGGASAYNLYGTSPGATQLPTGMTPTASLPVEAGVTMALNKLGVPQAPLIGLLYNLDQNRKLDLGALKSAFGNGGQPGDNLPGTSVWVEGVLSFGTRDARGAVQAAEYSSNGISVGVDMPVSDAFTWGVGVGLARDTTYVGTDGSRNQSQGYSLAAYGSYLLGQNAFVEGMLGVGTIDYDMRRWVDPAADFAVSNRKGVQLFGSIGAGLEYRNNGQMISPYMRLDVSQDQLQAVTETGAGSYALHYFEQTNNASQAVLGLRGEAIHSTAFGWAVPRARVEWRQDLQGGSDAVISYADQIGGTRYSIAPIDSIRSAFVFGLGSEFLFRDGWALGVDYQLSRASSTESSYALRLRLSKEFGVKGLRKLLQNDEEIADEENEITVDSSATWDDNVTRAKLGSDIRSDMFYTVNISRTLENQLSENMRYLLTGVATGERFQNFNGLSRFAMSGEAALQYRESAEFSAPTYSLVGKVVGEDFQSAARDGNRYSVGATVLMPMTDRINLFGALTYTDRQANSTVFTTEETSLRMNVDYTLRSGATLYLSGEIRDGDIVSSGHPSLENITLASAKTVDDAFPGGNLFAYRLKGATAIGTIGYNFGLGARDSVDLSWRFVQSTPYGRPAWATSPRSYVTNQISASYLMRF